MSVYPAQRQENTVIIDLSGGVNSSTNQWLFESPKDCGIEEEQCLPVCVRAEGGVELAVPERFVSNTDQQLN